MLRSLTYRMLALVLLMFAHRFPASAQAPTVPKLAVPLELPADVLLYALPSEQSKPTVPKNRKMVVVQESAQWLRVQTADDASKQYYLPRTSLQIRPDETVAQFVARGGEALPSGAVAARAAAEAARVAAAEAAVAAADKAHNLAFPRDSATGRIAFAGVVEVPGVSQAALYGRAHEWLAKRSNATHPVVELQDRDAGKLIGKVALAIKPGTAVSDHTDLLRATISLFSKDGRYKYIFTDFNFERPTVGVRLGAPLEDAEPKGISASTWQEVRQRASTEAQRLVTELKAAMSKKADSDF